MRVCCQRMAYNNSLNYDNFVWIEPCSVSLKRALPFYTKQLQAYTHVLLPPAVWLAGLYIPLERPALPCLQSVPLGEPSLLVKWRGVTDQLEKITVIFDSFSSFQKCNLFKNSSFVGKSFLMMMIAFITIKSSLVPLIEGLCARPVELKGILANWRIPKCKQYKLRPPQIL